MKAGGARSIVCFMFVKKICTASMCQPVMLFVMWNGVCRLYGSDAHAEAGIRVFRMTL